MSKSIQLAAAILATVLLALVGYRSLAGGGERSALPAEAPVLALTPLPEEPEPPVIDLVGDESAPARSAVERIPAVAGDWVVRGRLTLGVDDPYPGGSVRVEVYEGWVDAEDPQDAPAHVALVTTDEHGEFDCPFPKPATKVTVIARPDMPDHFSTQDWHGVAFGLAAPKALNPRAYPIDSTLMGRVVDPDGNPVPGARITTYLFDGESDADGRFALPASSVIPKIQGKVLAKGYAEKRFTVIPLEPGEIDAGVIELVRGMRVTGRVEDESGRPVAGATVSSSWQGYGKRLGHATATTGIDGRFVLGEIDPAGRLSLTAMKAGYVQTSVALEGSDGKEPKTEIEIVLLVGGVIRGRVSHADGSPARDIRLCVGFHPRGNPRVEAHSDEDGRFEFPNAPSGAQTLWAVRGGKETARLPVIVPEAGGVLEGLELTLEEGHHLAGVVLDEHDEPMPWVRVHAWSRRRETYVASFPSTDREGRFRIAGLPGNRITLGFLEGGYSRYEENFTELDRDDLVIRMQRAGRLAGRVVDGRTGEPLESFTIRFVAPELGAGEERLRGYSSQWSRSGLTFIGTGGTWNADSNRLDAGKWIGIEATAPGYGPSIAARVQVVASPDPDELVLRLFAGAVVHGLVTEATSGQPVAGATVKRFTAAESLEQQRGEREHPYWTETDANGRFELVRIPAGAMSLGIDHPEWGLTLDGPFEVPEGGSVVTRQIIIGKGNVLTGHLLRPNGSALAGETVELSSLDTDGEKFRMTSSTTDEHGAFHFKHLLAGLYHLRWVETREEQSCYRITKLIEVSAESQSTCLQLAGKASLHGTLYYEGQMPDLVTVFVFPMDWSNDRKTRDGFIHCSLTYAVFAEHGSFELEGLEAGRYRVHAFIPSHQPGVLISGSAMVDVSAEGSIDVAVDLKRTER